MPAEGYPFEFENPFNVEAEWIRYLRELNRDLFYRLDWRRTSQPSEDPEEEVGGFFHSLPHICDGKRLLRSGVPPEEKEAVRAWKHYGSFFHMLRFLSLYTEQLTCAGILDSTYFFSLTHTEDGRETEFESLNTNVEETGLLILPKVKTFNDPLDPAKEEDPAEEEKPPPGAAPPEKRWAADRLPGIQDQLSHTFYIETEELACKDGRRYRVANSVLRRHVFPENKKTLRIAVCPLAHADLLDVRTYREETENGTIRRLCSAGLKSGRLVHDKVSANLIAAGGERADIVIFPEMLGDAELLSPEFLSGIRRELKDRGCPVPALTLAPTWWHDNRNELYVLDAAGRCLCVQPKQSPYLLKGKDGQEYAEDLREPERVIHVVHIPDVGRLTFPICRDCLDGDYVQLMLRHLRSTFLLCPSYSPHKMQFDLVSRDGIPYGCYMVWCNTCAAYWEKSPPEHIGLVSGPRDLASAPCALIPACGGECGDEKTICMFLVELAMDRTADISYRHICERRE